MYVRVNHIYVLTPMVGERSYHAIIKHQNKTEFALLANSNGGKDFVLVLKKPWSKKHYFLTILGYIKSITQ